MTDGAPIFKTQFFSKNRVGQQEGCPQAIFPSTGFVKEFVHSGKEWDRLSLLDYLATSTLQNPSDLTSGSVLGKRPTYLLPVTTTLPVSPSRMEREAASPTNASAFVFVALRM